jgi:nucleolar protein 9
MQIAPYVLLIIPFLKQQYTRHFIESLVSMEGEHVFDAAKDSGGARVIEAFLSSDTGAKIKLKLVAK